MTFWLYYANLSLVSQTTYFNSSITFVNITSLNSTGYIYNVSIYDNLSNYNSTEARSININTLPTVSQIGPYDGFTSLNATF